MISAKQGLQVRTLGFLLAILLAVAGRAAAQTNTAFGDGALENNQGSENSAFGFDALFNNTTGVNNTASGFAALLSNTSANNNTATGAFSLFNSTGRGNTADGVSALANDSTGFRNTAGGASALQNNTTGNNNIALGWEAGVNLTTGSNNIEIGSQGVADDDGTIRLGTPGTQTATFIAGVSDTAISGVDVVVSTNGQLGVLPSSVRYKRDIRSLDNRSQRLLQLRPVSFRYRQDPSGERQYGLIAEEVAEVYPELVVHDNKGEVESVQYRELIPLMLSEMQHQQAEMQREQAAVANLKAENARLEARLTQLEENRAVASR
jgi:hypothetical protein